MSDEESDGDQRAKADEMPAFNMRFTDMSPANVEKAIKRKFTNFNNFWPSLVIAKCNAGQKFDKDTATAITKAFAADPDLQDECAGWHVIVGKSFASAIQY